MTDNVVKLKTNKNSDPNTLSVKISTSTGNQGRVTNQTMTWLGLCERLTNTSWDSVTLDEYLAKPIAWQDKRKNQGFFVGGQFDQGVRKLHNLHRRTLLTFDVDNCTPKLLRRLLTRKGWLAPYEYFVYSTRKHTAEKPRIRIVMPMTQAVPTPNFGPLARIIASYIDPDMVAVDPVSFRASQIMYWPSTCREAEFVSHRNEGKLLDYGETLTEFGDWMDYSKLPRSPRERSLREIADKTTDPTTKRGIVGAFCRTYDISAAIDAFLPDRYVPGETGADGVSRYSYVNGSTTNGAVVYDGGTQLYSWHSTDPCSDRLVNAWDMVRLHRFGGLDRASAADDTEEADPRSMPSYKAMAEFAGALPDVAKELAASNYDMNAMDSDSGFDDLGFEDEAQLEPGAIAVSDVTSRARTRVKKEERTRVSAPAPAPAPAREEANDHEWLESLDCNDKGGVKNTLHNIVIILENDKRFAGCLAYNDFTEEPVVIRRIRSKQYGADTGPIRDKSNGDAINESIAANIRRILEGPRGEGKTGWGLRVTDRDLKDAFIAVGDKRRFHPVRRYLEKCQWDGVPRIRQMLHHYFHADDNSYIRAVSYAFMVGAVARIMEPGYKFDYVVVLQGAQGIMKSSALAALAGPGRFAELRADIDKTDKVVENIRGKWIVEIPELVSFGSKETSTLKALFSAQSDRVRLAWSRGPKDYLRQNVFAGTTNENQWLKDKTGNRRYLRVVMPGLPVRISELTSDRDLLWAEAYQVYKYLRRQYPNHAEPLPIELKGKDKKTAEAQHEEAMISGVDDLFDGQIEVWLNTPTTKERAECGWRPDQVNTTSSFEDDLDTTCHNVDTIRTMTCVRDVARFALDLDEKRIDHRVSLQIGQALLALGWVKKGKIRLKGPLGVTRVFVKPG